MIKQESIIQRLAGIVEDEKFIIEDLHNVGFSQLEKDTVKKDVNKLLDYVVAITDQMHIKVLLDEAVKKLQNKKMDDLRKNNLERLKDED